MAGKTLEGEGLECYHGRREEEEREMLIGKRRGEEKEGESESGVEWERKLRKEKKR